MVPLMMTVCQVIEILVRDVHRSLASVTLGNAGRRGLVVLSAGASAWARAVAPKGRRRLLEAGHDVTAIMDDLRGDPPPVKTLKCATPLRSSSRASFVEEAQLGATVNDRLRTRLDDARFVQA